MNRSKFLCITAVAALISVCSGGLLRAVAQIDPARDILVYFVKGVDRMPVGQPAMITDTSVQLTLARFNVSPTSVTSAFPDFREADTLQTTANGRTISTPNMAKIFRIRVPAGDRRLQLIEELKRISVVLFAEADGLASVDVVPNDQYFSQQWALQAGGGTGRIQAPEAWDIFTGSTSTKIGVVDLGVDATHPDLNGKVSGHTTVYDHHGTHVAGIAAAKTNNTTGVAGVNWNAQILAKAFNNGTESGDAYIHQIVTEAVNEGSDALNNSWKLVYNDGTPGRYSTTVRLAFAYAYKYNRVAVATIGDTGPTQNIVQYPGSFGQGIIAVGSTNSGDLVSNFSTRGNAIDVVAPGENILSTYRNGNFPGDANYHSMSGTSMAAPHVAGIASLLKGYDTTLFNDDFENIIKISANDKGPTGWDTEYGTGRVNAKRAMDRVRSPNTLTRSYVLGGTDQGGSAGYWMTIYGAQAVGLQDGNYWVKRHEVRQTVTYTQTPNVVVWGRGAVTNGWANEGSVNFTYGFCEPVAGTVTSTSATLRTFIYEVFTASDQANFLGWYPTPASNVRYEYTVHGVPFPPIPQNLVITNDGQNMQHPQLSWEYTPPLNFLIFNVYRNYWDDLTGWYGDWQLIGSTTLTTYTDLGETIDPSSNVFAYYRVTALNTSDLESDPSNMAGTRVFGPPTRLADGNDLDARIAPRPENFVLFTNYPNPFNPETQISFGLPEPAEVTITISDLLGREITTLTSGKHPAGYHTLRWVGSDGNGNKVVSGIYFYRMNAVGESGRRLTKVMKMALMK